MGEKGVFLLAVCLVSLCNAENYVSRVQEVSRRTFQEVSRTRDSSCGPGAKWSDKYNDCICETDVITKDPNRNCRLSDNVIQEAENCHGKVWKSRCNMCYCTAVGKPKCTSYRCPLPAISNTGYTCEPGTTREEIHKGIRRFCSCNTNGELICFNRLRDRKGEEPPQRLKRDIPRDNHHCQPGYSWSDGCNSKSCMSDGLVVSTAMACPQKDFLQNVRICKDGAKWKLGNKDCECTEKGFGVCREASRKRRETAESKCQPGYSWSDGCNSKSCTNDGQIISTEKVCPKEDYVKNERMCEDGAKWNLRDKECSCTAGQGVCEGHSRNRRETVKRECQPGFHWSDGCNSLTCMDNGNVMTTYMECSPEVIKKDVRICEDGAKWQVGDKECQCNEDGYGECKINSRERRETGERQCQPGFTWTDGCNSKSCTEDGLVMSTFMSCPPEKYVKNERICEDGATWKLKNKDCTCKPEGYGVCEKKSRTRRETVKRECQPGFHWSDGCNFLSCMDDGHVLTTLKRCPPEVIKKDVRICEDGAKWQVGDKECQCNEDGYGECKINSRKRRETGERQCQPGFTWTDGCNSKSCTEDGLVMSTFMSCPPEKYLKNERICEDGATWRLKNKDCACKPEGYGACEKKSRTRRETENNCQPNYKWSDGCNNFACLPNGIAVGSLKLCPPEEYLKDVHVCEIGANWTLPDGHKCHCSPNGQGVCEATLKRKRRSPSDSSWRKCAMEKRIGPCQNTYRRRRRQEPESIVCQPGHTSSDGCNTMTCSKAGMPQITQMLCKDHTPKPVTLCEPGASWSLGIKDCNCSEGKPVCQTKSLRRKREAETLCQPGFSWSDGCNSKSCTPDGHVMSTEMACPPEKYVKNERMCENGAKWKLRNKDCSCSQEGHVVCQENGRRRREILGTIRPGLSCQPNYNMTDGCNNYICHPTGVIFGIGLWKLCPPEKILRNVAQCENGASWTLPDGQECHCTDGKGFCEKAKNRKRRFLSEDSIDRCQPGHVSSDGCNTMTCSDHGVPMMTLMACQGYTPQEVTLCEPGATWSLRRHECSCSEQGKAVCKKTSQRRRREEPGSIVCQPGHISSDGCNSMVCNENGVPQITEMLCKGHTPKPVTFCEPGASWSMGVKGCTCSKDGKAVCRTKSLRRKREEIGSGEDTIDICQPGHWSTDGCNSVKCGKNGVPMMTKMACESYTPQEVTYCEPGATWSLRRHECSCSKQGKAVCQKTSRRRRREEPGSIVCQPGHTSSDGCNSMTCSETGEPQMTAMLCKNHTPKPVTFCTPGASYTVGIKDCTCSKDGKPDCQTKSLRRKREENDIDIDEPRKETNANVSFCSLGEITIHGCDICICTLTGEECHRQLCYGPEISAKLLE